MNNHAKFKEKDRLYRLNFKHKIKERDLAYREKNLKEIRERQRIYSKTKRDRKRIEKFKQNPTF